MADPDRLDHASELAALAAQLLHAAARTPDRTDTLTRQAVEHLDAARRLTQETTP